MVGDCGDLVDEVGGYPVVVVGGLVQGGADLAQPVGHLIDGSAGTHVQHGADLVGRTFDLPGREPGGGQIEAGHAHIAEAALFRGILLVGAYRVFGVPFGLGGGVRVAEPESGVGGVGDLFGFGEG